MANEKGWLSPTIQTRPVHVDNRCAGPSHRIANAELEFTRTYETRTARQEAEISRPGPKRRKEG
jgi:hypothetical protein